MSKQALAAASRQAHQAETTNRATLGFWIYLMTDCMLFAALLATYAVMQTGTAGGPKASELFDLPFALVETLLLLTSSFVCGLAVLALRAGRKQLVLQLLAVVFILGATFVGMEIHEFRVLAAEGANWQRSGFLSAYFTLVGTHGIHIMVGLIWLLALVVQLIRGGLTASVTKRLALFSIFWHFLDVIWIFIFTVVYLWSGRL